MAGSPVRRIVYKSRSIVDRSSEDYHVNTLNILNQAILHNAQHSITGVLVCIDDVFIQVLEGQGSDVEALYTAICCDLRHDNVTLVSRVDHDQRHFDIWSMGYLEGTVEVRKVCAMCGLDGNLRARDPEAVPRALARLCLDDYAADTSTRATRLPYVSAHA